MSFEEHQNKYEGIINAANDNRKNAALEVERKKVERLLNPPVITRPHESDEQYIMRRDAPVFFAEFFTVDKDGFYNVEDVSRSLSDLKERIESKGGFYRNKSRYKANHTVIYTLKQKKENTEHKVYNFGRLETVRIKNKKTGRREKLTETYDAKCLGCEHLKLDKRESPNQSGRVKNPFYILSPPQERCPHFNQCDKPSEMKIYTHTQWNPVPIESKRFIKINAASIKVLHVEIDEPDCDFGEWRQASYFEDRGVPVPNCITESERGVHLFYFLAFPISRKKRTTVQFFEDVRLKIIIALGADSHCNIRGMVRNPFFEEAVSLWFREDARTLEELNTNVKLESKYGTQKYDLEYRVGNRNNALFRRGLIEYHTKQDLYTQDLKNGYRKEDVAAMERFLKGIVARHPKVEAFPLSELRQIARNIIFRGDKYKVRAERDYGRLKREGLAGPDVGPWSKSREVREGQVKTRQAWGASHSARIRSNNLQVEAIRAIINYRHAFPGKHLPAATLAKISCVSSRTVQQPEWKSFICDCMEMPLADLEALLIE